MNLSSPPAPASPAMRYPAAGLLYSAHGVLWSPFSKKDMRRGVVGGNVKPTKTPAQGRCGLIRIWIGVAVMSAGAIALFRLGGDFPRIIVGVALAVCLGMVIVMLWIDHRAERETTRLTERR